MDTHFLKAHLVLSGSGGLAIAPVGLKQRGRFFRPLSVDQFERLILPAFTQTAQEGVSPVWFDVLQNTMSSSYASD